MGVKVGSVYSTTDYSVFKKLRGNREIFDQRKRMLVESISTRGWIRNPIVVNENMEIIDGQGRFEALKELGLPVEYVVAKGTTINDCISLNIKQSNWKNSDYVKCYADMGNEDYILLLSIYGLYPNLPDTCVNTLAGTALTDGSKGSQMLREGLFKVEDKEHIHERCAFVNECLSIIGQGNGRLRNWCAVFKFVYYCERIPCGVFLERLKRNRAFITPCVTAKQVLEVLEKIYNYGAKKNKVYFVPEWDHFIRKTKGEN
jgi:hypothetical protein